MAYGLVVLMGSLLVVRAPTLADGEAVSEGEASGVLAWVMKAKTDADSLWE